MADLWLDYQQNRPAHWSGMLFLALVLGALSLTVAYYLELNDNMASWENKLARAEREHGLRKAGAPSVREGEEQALEVQQANEVLRQLSLPWEQLFLTVESVAGNDVSLLALEPDMEKRVVKISGEAKDFVALLNYITRLEAQEVFGPVYLQNHQVQQEDPNRPVRFALLADWRGKP